MAGSWCGSGTRRHGRAGAIQFHYAWTQTGGPAVTLSDPAGAAPTFAAPDAAAVLTFALAVTDSRGLADPTPDAVVITVQGHHVFLPSVIR